MLKLGFYKHFENGRYYEVTKIATHQDTKKSGNHGRKIVEYHDVENGVEYTRFLNHFTEAVFVGRIMVDRFAYKGDDLTKIPVKLS